MAAVSVVMHLGCESAALQGTADKQACQFVYVQAGMPANMHKGMCASLPENLQLTLWSTRGQLSEVHLFLFCCSASSGTLQCQLQTTRHICQEP